MSKKLYVGNLSFQANDQDLEDLFNQFGDVVSARIITDRDSGRSRGFAFVEMSDDNAAQSAIDELNDKDFMGRNISVNIARERQERSGGGGGGNRRGGGFRGDRGDRGGRRPY